MTSDQFMASFGHIVDSPGGVGKLRDLIYHFAFIGGLVAHSEVSAAKLVEDLAKIESPAGRTRHAKLESPAGFYPIPHHWRWVNVGDVGHDWGQTKPSSDFTYIDVSAIDNHRGIVADGASVVSAANAPSRARKVVRRGTIIYSTVRPYLLNIAIIERDFSPAPIASTAFAVLHPHEGIEPRFVYHFLRSPAFVAYVESVQSGVAYPAISDQKFFAASFPLAPTEEQKRIVGKVDELIALCDQLEAQQQERKTRQANLARALLARFAQTPTQANLNLLFHRSYEIDPGELRKVVLQLAVQGKLVQREGKWRHGTLQEVAAEIVDCPHSTPKWTKDGKICVRTSQFRPGFLDLTESRFVSEETYRERTQRLVPTAEDILYSREGGILGIACRVPSDTELCLGQRMMLIRSGKQHIPGFLELVLNSPVITNLARDRTTGGAAPRINVSTVKTFPIPIPPLSEQRRIVAKVEGLMQLVDQLEEQMALKLKASTTYAQNVVAAIIGSRSNKTEGAKAPETKPTMTMRPVAKQSESKLKRFVLRSFRMSSGYRSLDDPNCKFHEGSELAAEPCPVCLVGLNGSGKSNLIEAIADTFCFLELINLPWKSLSSESSRYRRNDQKFEATYSIEDHEGSKLICIRKTKKTEADFFIVDDDGVEIPVVDPAERLAILPRRIVGYSSGLNETVSHTFLRTRTLYSQEVRDAAPPVGSDLSMSEFVHDTKTLYMDYENNAEILLCNYIFQRPEDLEIFREFTRVIGISSFELRFNRKIAGKSGENAVARITEELADFLQSFARCAQVEFDADSIEHQFSYKLDEPTKKRFKKEFKTAEGLFLAMYKWSLLNALVLDDSQRKVFLKEDITKGTLERPPVVAPKQRLFDVADVKVNLSEPRKEIDYSGLSDGEHQFVQVFGTILLFNAPGTLFLLDEPESHFNPEWRTRFNSILHRIPNANTHEYIISTHSPYIVSGARRENVFKFERVGAKVLCKQVDFETYGASFDVLLNKLFSIKSLIDESARAELGEILKRNKLDEMETAVGDFAESQEKRRLYEAILKKGKVK